MKGKRIAIATTIGLLCGLFCAFVTVLIAELTPALVITAGLFYAVVYNLIAIGLFVGFGDNIPLHPVLRGALFGALIGLAMIVQPIID